MKSLLSIEALSGANITKIMADAGPLKKDRGHHKKQPLAGQSWAMIFSKSSTRTRVSFEVAIRELGGAPMFLNINDIQLGRGEDIKDTARVLGRMVHGAVIRTYAQKDVEDFAKFSNLSTINALTDDEHPCQIITDIFTFEEKRGPIAGKIITWVGDGASNMVNSWMFAAIKLGFELRIAAPKSYQPKPEILKRAEQSNLGSTGKKSAPAKGKIIVTEDMKAAAKGADMVYTDVWISMGQEKESAERIKHMTSYKVDAALLKLAKPKALVMHCLPAYKGKEIDEETFEAHAQTIFDQAENRLHVQKSILTWVTAKDKK